MIRISIPASEMYDDVEECFKYEDGLCLHFEHSLASISKWESKFHTPYFSDKEKTTDEIYYYLWCMIVEDDIDQNVVFRLSNENINDLIAYMNDTATATTITYSPGYTEGRPKKREIITSEKYYYWMVKFNIPVEFEHWHINRLTKLIELFSVLDNPKKMGKKDTRAEYARLKKARRAKKRKR